MSRQMTKHVARAAVMMQFDTFAGSMIATTVATSIGRMTVAIHGGRCGNRLTHHSAGRFPAETGRKHGDQHDQCEEPGNG